MSEISKLGIMGIRSYISFRSWCSQNHDQSSSLLSSDACMLQAAIMKWKKLAYFNIAVHFVVVASCCRVCNRDIA